MIRIRRIFTYGILALFALLLAGVLAFGGLVHALLPHQHAENESVASLLHSAVSHEQKKFTDVLPAAPVFLPLIILVSVLTHTVLQNFLRAANARAPSLSLVSRGILLYRRFG